MRSTGDNFCCLMAPAGKAHLASDRYKYSPRTVFFALIEIWAMIYISKSELCFPDNSMK